MINKNIITIFTEIANMLEINSVPFKPQAYKRAIFALQNSNKDVFDLYKENKLKGLKTIKGIGDSMAKKIEEYIKKGTIKYYEELKKETAIRQIIAYYFETKGLSLQELKENAKKRKIVYSRFTKPAKQLLELAGTVEKAKEAIKTVSNWANSRKLDYAIETVFKKWLELGSLKPKEIVKKPFYRGDPMVWSETKKKWYVISKYGDWLEYCGKESEMEWREVK